MKQAVLVYDSDCLLCSKSIQRVLKYDTSEHFLFSTCKGDFAKKKKLSGETVVIITPNQQILTHHNAVRYILAHLPKLRWLDFMFVITPSFLQKWIYTLLAKNRKWVFGKHSCLLPQQIAERFIS